MRQQITLGNDEGQPRLQSAGPAPQLGASKDVLPEFEHVDVVPRPIWRHPAFLVSSILAVLALLAALALTLFSMFGPNKAEVRALEIETGTGNAHLTWQATGPVQIYAITGNNSLDLTQLISGENEAWIPAALNLYTPATCFIVRPATSETQNVALDGDTLRAQRAQSVCVRDGEVNDTETNDNETNDAAEAP